MFLIFVIRNGFIYEVQTGLTIVTESPAARRGFSCLSKLHQLNGQEDIYVIGKKYALKRYVQFAKSKPTYYKAGTDTYTFS